MLVYSSHSHSRDENKYAVVFMDYLTKWPKVFAVPDQIANTIARLLVEEIDSNMEFHQRYCLTKAEHSCLDWRK